jgi:hemoglobin
MDGLEYDGSLYAAVGGHPTLERVHKVFYDKLYEHDWLKGFFVGVPRAVIEGQQTDFIAQCMGGPERYLGRLPAHAHQHMFITDELFELRHAMLDASIRECGVPDPLRLRWLKIDHAFKRRLVKSSPDECQGRYRTEAVVIVPKPG